MRVRAATLTAAVGAATTWLAVPLLSLSLGRSLDDASRSRVRAQGRAPVTPAAPAVVVPLRRSPTPWATVPAPRPAADAVRRVSGVG